MPNRLYIVGNGFDMHHGIESSYWAFGDFLKSKDLTTYDFVDRYFSIDDSFWSEFEQRLADLDSDALIEDASGFLMGYGDDDWSDSGHHDFQYEIDRAVRSVSKTMRAHFGDWIRQLSIPAAAEVGDRLLHLDTSARFLNFNYTRTLQELYGVPNKRVMHIHGSAADADSQLVLGHGWDPGDQDPYRFERNPEDADMRVIEGISIIDDYFTETFKPTDRILDERAEYFSALRDLDLIVVLGHSLAAVDLPYLRRIAASVQPATKWALSYFESSDHAGSTMAGLGTPIDNVELFTLVDISLAGDRGLI